MDFLRLRIIKETEHVTPNSGRRWFCHVESRS